jgi:tRNA (mo5U34)-methyltransferase
MVLLNAEHNIQADDLLASLYEAILHRDPDPAGLSFYSGLIRSGTRLADIIRLFLASSERMDALDRRGATLSSMDVDVSALIAQSEARAARIHTPAEALLAYPPATWFHSCVLSDGTTICAPVKGLDVLKKEFDAFLNGIDIKGRSVLDIGSFDGAFAFEAKRRGAARVLATDYWAWTYLGHRVLERFLYVRRDAKTDVEYRVIDVPDISVSSVGQFDIVMFLGVFYHLREPITILDHLGLITRNCLILETYLDLQDVPYPAMRHYPGSEAANDSTTWWGPNRACVEALLKHAGFREILFTVHPINPARGIFHAFRDVKE